MGNPLISGGGLVGLGGAAISGLAYLLIKPKPVKILAKMHVPILVAPYSNGSIIALPEKFKSFSGSSLDVKKVFVSFPVANVEGGAKKIADEIPMDSESFNAEIMAVELMNKITEIITPARGGPLFSYCIHGS
ncbi:hypothetical protein [Thermococcus sp. JCM 11816]|uniref:hypothetical protein n=1 Tax=Thermococcus sp. (strain JCM 11816 / KS-1) TaxID=1295125 RepID=UPI0006CFF99F